MGIKANREHIDEPDWDTKWDTEGLHWCPPQWFLHNFMRFWARQFDWKEDKSQPRLQKTQKATKAAIETWLKRSCCGEKVPGL